MKEHKKELKIGLKAGIPIALAYFAVSMALGIQAKGAGLTVFQGFLTSLLVNASAGEYAGFQLIASQAPYIEMVLMTIIVNARYILMSFALSQKLDPDMSTIHRFILSFYLTDEFFGLAIIQNGYVNPWIIYGAILIAPACWALGTAVGVGVGSTLPPIILNSLSVALYGMFLAIIIPPAKKNKVVLGLVITAFASSYISTLVPFLSTMRDGTRIIILTIIISALAAGLFPVKEEENNE